MDNVNVTFPISIGRVRPSPFFPLIIMYTNLYRGARLSFKDTQNCLLVDGWKKSRKDVVVLEVTSQQQQGRLFPVAHGEMNSW